MTLASGPVAGIRRGPDLPSLGPPRRLGPSPKARSRTIPHPLHSVVPLSGDDTSKPSDSSLGKREKRIHSSLPKVEAPCGRRPVAHNCLPLAIVGPTPKAPVQRALPRPSEHPRRHSSAKPWGRILRPGRTAISKPSASALGWADNKTRVPESRSDAGTVYQHRTVSHIAMLCSARRTGDRPGAPGSRPSVGR